MSKMLSHLFRCVAFAVLLAATSSAWAEARSTMCNNYSMLKNMFTDVCWSGMFPIRIAGATMISGKSGVPEDAYKSPLCKCGGDISKGQFPKIGFSVGFWAPAKVIDVTRQPMCFASLGGTRASMPSIGWFGSGSNTGRADRSNGFYNWVAYSAPLIYMMRLLDENACAPDGLLDFDVINMSPLFPNWNDVVGRYAAFMNPESMFLGTVSALATMPIDSMSTIVNDKPLNYLHWAAGQWGMLYPMTGFDESSSTSDTVRFSSLIAARSVALMHRLGLLRGTVGGSNICERKVQPIMRKDAFRWQMVAPSPEYNTIPGASGNGATVRMIDRPHGRGTCTHPTGLPTPLWGMWRNVPATGEDHSYMIFQYTDCCFGITPAP